MILSKHFPIIGLALAITFCACTKKSSNTPKPAPTLATFTWTENGGAEIIADSAYYDSPYKTIKAWKTGKFIEINLTGGTPLIYPIGTTNALAMLIGSNLYNATTGNITITANAISKMSGTFTTTGTGASITMLDGKFTDIAER